MQGFKSAILPELKTCQNGTFEPLHEIQKIFWPRHYFWSIMKMAFTKHVANISKGPPNPGYSSVKVENWDFLKKDSQDFKLSKLKVAKIGNCQNWKLSKLKVISVFYAKS